MNPNVNKIIASFLYGDRGSRQLSCEEGHALDQKRRAINDVFENNRLFISCYRIVLGGTYRRGSCTRWERQLLDRNWHLLSLPLDHPERLRYLRTGLLADEVSDDDDHFAGLGYPADAEEEFFPSDTETDDESS